jgi:hypothetical protein
MMMVMIHDGGDSNADNDGDDEIDIESNADNCDDDVAFTLCTSTVLIVASMMT